MCKLQFLANLKQCNISHHGRAHSVNSRAFSPRLQMKTGFHIFSLSSELIRKGFWEDLGSSRPKDWAFRTNLKGVLSPVVHLTRC